MPAATVQKVTISLPKDLIAFADTRAIQQGITRSKFIAELLAECKLREEELLAAEGYQFYAEEAKEFARASQQL